MPSKPIAIIMCDYWAPTKSANTVCIEKLLGPLAEHYDVCLVTADGRGGDGLCRIIAIGDIPINDKLMDAGKDAGKLAFVKLMNKFTVFRYLPRYPMRSREWADRYAAACKDLIEHGGG